MKSKVILSVLIFALAAIVTLLLSPITNTKDAADASDGKVVAREDDPAFTNGANLKGGKVDRGRIPPDFADMSQTEEVARVPHPSPKIDK